MLCASDKKQNIPVQTALFCPDPDFDPAEHRALYSPARLEKLKKLKREDSRIESAAAELAFRAALRMAWEAGVLPKGESSSLSALRAAERPWLDVVYGYDALGRPVMNQNGVFSADDFAFMSLSHTRGGSAAAVSAAPVGVDVERLRILRMPTLLSLCPDEAEALIKSGDKPGEELMEKALRMLVSGECVVKLTGGKTTLRSFASRGSEERKYHTCLRRERLADGKEGFIGVASETERGSRLRVFRSTGEILNFILG